MRAIVLCCHGFTFSTRLRLVLSTDGRDDFVCPVNISNRFRICVGFFRNLTNLAKWCKREILYFCSAAAKSCTRQI